MNSSLPRIMIAPTGARRTKQHHRAMPITIAEIVETAVACFAEGAGAIHAHVRDADQKHVLDAGMYGELLGELASAVPQMSVQITTEAVGHYSPDEQRALVRQVMPKSVSVALREMVPDEDSTEASKFYHWASEADIAVQHIVYDPAEIDRFAALVSGGVIPASDLQMLFVLGTYAQDEVSDPQTIAAFLSRIEEQALSLDWAVCAFGPTETQCLAEAFRLGGKARVGFENSLWNNDGSLAGDNAERVREVATYL